MGDGTFPSDWRHCTLLGSSSNSRQNKDLSDSLVPALALQGASWIAREMVGLVSVTLHVKQFEGPPLPPSTAADPVTIIEVGESISGLMGLDRMAHKSSMQLCLDSVWREKSDVVFGPVRSRCGWRSLDEINNGFLRGNWVGGEAEATGPGGKSHIVFYVESLKDGWTGTQVWGFQIIDGQRRHVRNILVKKGQELVQCRVVYDYKP